MTASIQLRLHRDGDAEEIKRVALAAFAQFQARYTNWDAFSLGVARMLALAETGEIVVADAGDRLAGAVAYMPPHAPKAEFFDAGWPLMRMLAVDPAFRGRGIGRQLTEACIERARRDGCAAIALHTAPIMEVALAMYLRMGFAFVRDAPPIHGVAYGVYVKTLAP